MNFLKNVTKDVVLDQTTYGAIQSARWGAQDRTFLDQYPSGAALGVENHCFGPWAQVSPSRPKQKLPKKAPNLNQRQGLLGGIPMGAWEPRGPWAEPALALGKAPNKTPTAPAKPKLVCWGAGGGEFPNASHLVPRNLKWHYY